MFKSFTSNQSNKIFDAKNQELNELLDSNVYILKDLQKDLDL